MLEHKMEETGEEILNKYSAPCREELYKQGKISEEQYQKSQEYQRRNQTPPREFLEELHPKAIKDMKEFAEICKADMWKPKQMRNFWINYHNQKVKELNAPDQEKEICKVKIAKIIEIQRQVANFPVYTAEIKNNSKKITKILGKYFSDAKPNDYISVHWNCAIEKI